MARRASPGVVCSGPWRQPLCVTRGAPLAGAEEAAESSGILRCFGTGTSGTRPVGVVVQMRTERSAGEGAARVDPGVRLKGQLLELLARLLLVKPPRLTGALNDPYVPFLLSYVRPRPDSPPALV